MTEKNILRTTIRRPLVVFDMDGVLADFVGAACAIHERSTASVTSYDFWTDWRHANGVSYADHEFWAPIHEKGVDFWREIPRILAGADMLHHLSAELGVEVAIATDDGGHPGAIEGKRKWFEACLDIDAPLIFTREKHLLAQRGRLLIDDNPANCRAFRAAGGDAWLWPQPWNTEAIAEEAASWREQIKRLDSSLSLRSPAPCINSSETISEVMK